MAGVDADDAMPRAKRLKLLREAKARKERGESNNREDGALVAEALKPTVVKLTQEAAEKPKDMEDNVDMNSSTDAADSSENIVEKVVKVQEEGANTEDESDDELLNLAPKRANWDMERDIAPMLRKLERRTQHAIVEILREKLAAEQAEGSDEEDDEDEDEEEETEEVDE